MFPALGPRSYWFLSPWFLMKWFINFFQFCCLFFLRKNASNHFRLVTRTSVGTLSCVLCRLEWVTQHVIHWADAICRGTKIYKVPVALEGETNVRFFPVIFFPSIVSSFFFPLLPRPGRTVSVFSAVTPGRPRGGLRADQSRAPICPGLSSCLSCALMALAAMLGEVARFMLVKRGSVRLKGHVSGCRFVFHRDVQEEVSAQEKKNEREIVLVCLSPCGDSTGIGK